MNRALINASSGIVQKPLRYVLYVCESSEDAEAQAKSLPDQIADCKEYANNHGLLLVGEPIQESKSAKKSGNRPLFSQMLKDIEKGKYDAILAWHPERLSRNSLEAGMVVDMVDNGIIKDLRFPTFEFHNDSSGKLTLNMLFALSKQYSEHLSEIVQRGVDSNLEQGKSGGMPKWGYIRDDVSGYYKPDKNFKMIQKGWQMILNGASQMEVYRYWKMNNVERPTKTITPKQTRQELRRLRKHCEPHLPRSILLRNLGTRPQLCRSASSNTKLQANGNRRRIRPSPEDVQKGP